MKKFLLAVLLSMALPACSKDNGNNNATDDHISASQVPAAVMNKFNTRYPSATGQIEWEIEHGNTYKVKFFIGSQRWQAEFTTSGTFIEEKKI